MVPDIDTVGIELRSLADALENIVAGLYINTWPREEEMNIVRPGSCCVFLVDSLEPDVRIA